ncbi:hypothetical protein GCM10027159_16950 [Lysobacter terrae]
MRVGLLEQVYEHIFIGGGAHALVQEQRLITNVLQVHSVPAGELGQMLAKTAGNIIRLAEIDEFGAKVQEVYPLSSSGSSLVSGKCRKRGRVKRRNRQHLKCSN